MGRSPAKKHDRHRAKRKDSSERKRNYASQRAAADLFPDVVIEAGVAPSPFVDAVRSAVKHVRLDHATLLRPIARDFFRQARKDGFETVRDLIRRASIGGDQLSREVYADSMTDLSENIFRLLPSDLRERYLGYHGVDIDDGKPGPSNILVRFRSLLTDKSRGGTVYYSRRRPTLNVGGGEKVVAFSRHAIERINARTVYDPLTYCGSVDAYAFLEDCVYFESYWSEPGQPGFTFFNSCVPGFVSELYARQILGDLVPTKRYYYRVGYCPAVIEGDFIKAKTLLTPRMRGTPEHRRSILSLRNAESRREMEERVRSPRLPQTDRESRLQPAQVVP